MANVNHTATEPDVLLLNFEMNPAVDFMLAPRVPAVAGRNLTSMFEIGVQIISRMNITSAGIIAKKLKSFFPKNVSFTMHGLVFPHTRARIVYGLAMERSFAASRINTVSCVYLKRAKLFS